jgi:osmotically-inducible protein OsmY
MKTDMQIQKDVIEELRWDPSVRETEIGVAVKDGVVTLSGVVDSYADKYAAEHAAQRVSGVKAIAEDLRVQLVQSSKRSDTEIAHAAVTALKWDIQVPDDKITVKVDDGYITLSGNVEWKFQQEAAERDVRYLTGAKGVMNLIKVMPKRASKFEVSARIKDALRRNAERDADHITVEAADGKVTLKGVVRSFAERNDAERAAWSAPGVMSVDDRIAIG